jgi:hypothetical protein
MRHIAIAIAIVVVVGLAAGCSTASGASGGPGAPEDGSSQSPATVWAIGDSIMVGATDLLTQARPDLVIDAEVGRTFAQGLEALEGLVTEGEVPDALVFALGTNNGATPDQIADLIDLAGDIERVILVTVVVPRGWEAGTNAAIVDAMARYGSVTVADWNAVAAGDTTLFRSDGYHPNADGLRVWADLVLATIE